MESEPSAALVAAVRLILVDGEPRTVNAIVDTLRASRPNQQYRASDVTAILRSRPDLYRHRRGLRFWQADIWTYCGPAGSPSANSGSRQAAGSPPPAARPVEQSPAPSPAVIELIDDDEPAAEHASATATEQRALADERARYADRSRRFQTSRTPRGQQLRGAYRQDAVANRLSDRTLEKMHENVTKYVDSD